MTSISKEKFYQDFQKHQLIGEGSFGAVHKIMERKTKKFFALKLIYCQNLDELSQNLQELLLPLKIGDSKRPLVEVYYYLIDKTIVTNKAPGGYLFQSEVYYLGIIMELAERNLYEDILIKIKEKKTYPRDDIQTLFLDLVEILANMQKENIAHRDIKPDNILVIKGTYKLTDFGLARKMKLNRDNVYAGSPNYVSPKQRHAYDNNTYNLLDHDVYKSDVFSLGLTIFEMASLVNVEGLNTIEGRKPLKEYLTKLKKYGILDSWCCEAIERMVEFSEETRPDFLQLRNMLAPIYRARVNAQQVKALDSASYHVKINFDDFNFGETKKNAVWKEKISSTNTNSITEPIKISESTTLSLNQLISTKKKNPKMREFNKKTRNLATIKKEISKIEYKKVSSQKGELLYTTGVVLVEKLNILVQYGNNEIHFWTLRKNELSRSSQELRLDIDLLCMADCSQVIKSPTTAIIFVGGKNGALKLVAIREYKFDKVVKEKPEAHRRAITCMLFLPKSKRLITGSSDLSLKVWDFRVAEETLVYRSKLIGHSANISSLCTSDEDNKIFSGSVDNTIIMWDLNKESKIKAFTGHSDYITSMVYDYKNEILYSACGKGKIYLWDAELGTLEDSKEINEYGWISCIGYNAEKDLLFVPKDNKILVKNGMDTVSEFENESGAQQICSIIICDDYLITAGFDGSFNLFTS